MRKYELVMVARPDLDESALSEVVNKVTNWISESGGQIEKVDQWGKRKLAYPINKQTEGLYVQVNLNIPPGFAPQLERNLRYLETVMRFSIIQV